MNATNEKQQAHAAEASASWNEYMREQAYRAERYITTHSDEMNLPAPSCWQLIREEIRENEAAFIGGALVWLVLLGIGCVLVAVRQGWLS